MQRARRPLRQRGIPAGPSGVLRPERPAAGAVRRGAIRLAVLGSMDPKPNDTGPWISALPLAVPCIVVFLNGARALY